MSVVVSHASAIQEIEWTHAPTVIDVVGDIDEDMISDFDARLDEAVRSPQSHVVVAIHSSGGCTYTGMHMVNRLRSCGKPVVTAVLSRAWSAAALLAVAGGSPGCRYMSTHSSLMIHEVRDDDTPGGSYTEIQNETEHHRTLNDLTFRLFDEASQQSKGYFRRRYTDRGSVDMYLYAAESKKLGLIDHVGQPRLRMRVTCSSTLENTADDAANQDDEPHRVERASTRQCVMSAAATSSGNGTCSSGGRNSNKRRRRTPT